MKRISIDAGGVKLTAQLNETKVAATIWNVLPLTKGAIVGETKFIFHSVKLDSEQGVSAEVEVGELAFWPPGNAFCIFFGLQAV